MAVQRTERKLPPGTTPEDLGQAVSDGDYVLVSYVTDYIPRGSFCEYVVFALNGATALGYRWTVTDLTVKEVILSEVTAVGIQVVEAKEYGRIEVKVEVIDAGPGCQITVAQIALDQFIVPRNAA